MNPHRNFRDNRQQMRNLTVPCVPYLGKKVIQLFSRFNHQKRIIPHQKSLIYLLFAENFNQNNVLTSFTGAFLTEMTYFDYKHATYLEGGLINCVKICKQARKITRFTSFYKDANYPFPTDAEIQVILLRQGLKNLQEFIFAAEIFDAEKLLMPLEEIKEAPKNFRVVQALGSLNSSGVRNCNHINSN